MRRGDLERDGKVLEAQRLHQRTMFDLEMIKEIGYCHGIENYSRHLTQRKAGQPPPTLLDYLPSDALIVVDESHQTVPQVRGMYHGDRSRKEVLVEYGFRLPSALDNRPLNFEEWEAARRPAGLRVGDAGPVRAAQGRRRVRRAGDPADRADGSADRGAPGQGPGRRPAEGDPRPRRTQGARAGHDADQADGRGPDAPITRSWASRSATCTRTSTRSSASRSCATCAAACSTCWSASTCCAKASTCRKCRWSRFSMPTRKASCARAAR